MKIKEIRIYFECLEQANHYVKPSIESVLEKLGFDPLPTIKLVKLKKRYDLYSTNIQKILEWKNPDILVSLVYTTNIEVPLFMVEFSTAVFTEDHELQRFDGMVAAAENNVVFIKISPRSKMSEAEHGGKTDFNYKIPFALMHKIYDIMHFHVDWKANGSIVEVDDEYLSCPKDSTGFENVLEIIFMSLNWEDGQIDLDLLKEKTKEKVEEWFEELKKLSEEIHTIIKLNTSRLNVWDDTIEVKINRFGHAMDPERGMLVFYSILFNGNAISKMVFNADNDAWYKDIPKENDIRNIIENTGLQRSEYFLRAFYLGSGLYKIVNFEDFKQNIVKQNNTTMYLEVSEFINKFWDKLTKPLKTIFKFSKEFYIEDTDVNKRVVFSWNKDTDFHGHYENTRRATSLRKITVLDEDIVTYVTIHNVLKPQGYKILAASYPGAQGDRVILIMAGSGRRQPRKYVDVIAFSLIRNMSTLQANKGALSLKAINNEIKELKNYKLNDNYKKGLKSFFERFESDAINSIVNIGVGFWLNKRYTSDILKKLDLEDLDYFLFITKDMKKWFVSRIGNVDILSNYEGKIRIPTIWEPIAEETIDLLSFDKNGD